MPSILEATAVISAKDNTGAAFASVAKHLEGIGKAAKNSAQVEELAKSLGQVQSKLKAIDNYRSATKGLNETSTAYKKAAQDLRQFKAEISSAEKPSKALQTQLRALEREADRTAEAFKRKGTAAREASTALKEFGVPVATLAAEQARLRTAVDATTRSLQHQVAVDREAAAAHGQAEKRAEARAHGIRHHGFLSYALGGAAAYTGAHSIVTGIEKSVEQGAELQHERVALRNAGRTPEEIERMEAASRATSAAVPTATLVDNLKVLNETTGAFGSVEHAIEHLTFMQKAASVLHATAGEKIHDSPGELGNKLARFFEMRGTAGNPELFQKEASEMMRAMVFTGGNFNPAEMLNFGQQAKAALPNYSLRFLSKIAPSLITENGGERAGTYGKAFQDVILGKARDKKQVAAWEKYGLVDPKQVSDKKDSWTGGAVYNTNKALTDPDLFGYEDVLPKLAKHGVNVTDRLELTKVLGTLFRNGSSNTFANELWQHVARQRLGKDAGLIDKVEQPNEIFDRNLKTDPTIAIKALTASLDNLMGSITSAAMGPAAKGLAELASGINALADAAANHPLASLGIGTGVAAAGLAGAGWASYQLMNGFGLGASATALDTSAGLLSEAAVALGAKGAMNAAPGGGLRSERGAGVLDDAVKVAPKTGFLGSGGWKGAARGLSEGIVGAVLYEAGTQGITHLLDALPKPGYPKGYDPQAIRNGGVSGDLQRLFGNVHATVGNPSDLWLGGGRQAIERRSALAADHFRRDPEAARGEAYGRLPGLGSAGPVEATVRPDQISAKLEGQATVSVNVKVDGGTVTGQFASSTGNIHASVGTSMPSARTATNGRAAGPV